MTDIPQDLHKLAEKAMGHAVDSIVPIGGPLIPFLMVETDGVLALHRFPGRLEVGLEFARGFAQQQAEADRVVLAWDGYITVEGRRSDALFVNARRLARLRALSSFSAMKRRV